MKYFKGSVASKTPGPVPERSISANQGLKFCSFFVFYLPMYCWDESHIFFFLSFSVYRSEGSTVCS